MLKQITAAVLLLAFTASSFCRAVIAMDYYTNTTAYAKNCENKSLPKLHCNGKCQMMKKLQQEEKKTRVVPKKKQVIKQRSFLPNRFLQLLLSFIKRQLGAMRLPSAKSPYTVLIVCFTPLQATPSYTAFIVWCPRGIKNLFHFKKMNQ